MTRNCALVFPMEITQQGRDYAADQGIREAHAVVAGLRSRTLSFRRRGGEIYSS